MFRKLALGATLTLALACSALAGSASSDPPPPAPTAAAQAASAATLATATTLTAAGVQLTVAEMSSVSGGWPTLGWKILKRRISRFIRKVIGVIVYNVVLAVSEWVEEVLSDIFGGETQESTEATVENYASHSDFEAGNYASVYQEDSGWTQTQVWYGGGGGGCGGGLEPSHLIEQPFESCYMY